MGFKDECGVVGIYGSESCAQLTYYALTSLQHRGQESAGIAVSDGTKISIHKDMGLVGEVFKSEHFENLKGSIAIGHVRYATAGGRTIDNAQPFLNSFKYGSIALAHNGQLVNHAELRAALEDNGSTFLSSSDSEVILKLIVRKFVENGGKLGRPHQDDSDIFVNSLIQAIKEIKGSFALCIMTQDSLIAVRDKYGIRPMCLGRIDCRVKPDNDKQSCVIPDNNKESSVISGLDPGISYIITSESCAIDAVNGTFIRDIEPGEIVIIDKNGLRSFKYDTPKKQTCIFEYVYFARPDSVIDKIPVQEARYRMGQALALESPVAADVVIGVPDSGIGAAMGYSKASGIPYVTGIIKNKYIGRTFIAPTQKEREAMVYVKLNAIKSDLSGKSVVVIDDSIVRGTTSRRLVQILKRAGAKEVHFRVSSPPVKFPCHLGIDTPSKNELISSQHEVDEICREIGADSLAFISLEGMLQALGGDNFCKGCFCGEYPV